MPDGAGDHVILSQCNKAGWEGYEERWLAAAAGYRVTGGDPWRVAPADFTDVERARLHDLYDTRRNGMTISNIRRPAGGFRSCPVCGSPGGSSLDHALPRAAYPEFSIVCENLVPACTICNSEEKRETYRGEAEPERLIHPYYDTWASEPIWQVAFSADLEAVAFRPVPSPSVPDTRFSTVRFHLTTVLGRAWEEYCRRYWTDVPRLMGIRAVAEITSAAVERELALWLQESQVLEGVNSWRSAFLRGALDDPRVPTHLADVAKKPPS